MDQKKIIEIRKRLATIEDIARDLVTFAAGDAETHRELVGVASSVEAACRRAELAVLK